MKEFEAYDLSKLQYSGSYEYDNLVLDLARENGIILLTSHLQYKAFIEFLINKKYIKLKE